jgi:hypothetical protein
VAIIAISELEYFNYAVYISQQLPAFVRYLIGDYGISHLHFVNEPVAQEETKILLYLRIAHIGAIHNLRLASAIFADPKHISYYLYVRPSPIHYTAPLSSTFRLVPLYHISGACQALCLAVESNMKWTIDTKEITLYDKSPDINLDNKEDV